jgi:hypothetical protein
LFHSSLQFFLYDRQQIVIELEKLKVCLVEDENLMTLGNTILRTACCLFLSASLFAAKITGKVTNGTTGKPAGGEEVVLLSLAQGMDETSRAKTGPDGGFALDVPDEGAQHLLRVAHQGVNYFHSVPQGTASADITIYDSAKTASNVVGEGRVFRIQTSGNELEVSERYVLQNQSQPPRTWMGDTTLEIVLPEGAKLEEGMAAGPGGMPVASSPVPTGKPNHYAFVYPIRPGRSELQVMYKVPYSGSHDFSLTPGMPLAELGVMLPKGMRFNSSDGSLFPAPDVDGMTVFVGKNLSPSQRVSFTVSGEGSAPREAQSGDEAAPPSSAPGGGLGAPTGSPEPLGNARWYILGGVIVIMAAFAVWMVRRKPGAEAAHASAGTSPARASSNKQQPARALSPSQPQSRDTVLDALKEELFQLETDKAQGKISAQDYASAKAGLDALLRRHMKKTDEGRRS